MNPLRSWRPLAVLSLLYTIGLPTPGAAQDDGALLLVRDAPIPSAVRAADGRALLSRLNRYPDARPDAANTEAALAQLEAAGRALYDDGDVERAITLGRQGRSRLPDARRVKVEARHLVMAALWTLVHALSSHGPDHATEIRDILGQAWALDPTVEPSEAHYSTRIRHLWVRQQEDANNRWPRLVVLAPNRTACQVEVDGTQRGETGRALPVALGDHDVRVVCEDGQSLIREVTVGPEGARVDIPRWEFAVTVDGPVLRLASQSDARTLEAVLLSRTHVPWVLTLEADAPRQAAESREVLARVADRSGDIRSTRLMPDRAALWLSGGAPAPGAVGAKPWHYAMLGLGAVVVSAGGVTHGLAIEAVNETEAGYVDRRDEFAGFEAAYGTLYAVGGATMLTAAILIIVAETTNAEPDAPQVFVTPTAGGAAVVGRF